jgi:asparagine synthase (glutamine-hydrolysing)
MCGIAGILNLNGSLSPEVMAELGRAMAATMEHRGPDDAGLWLSDDNACVLAHRRLSIIDTSADGRQPMVSAEGGHAIAFNGEIYDYLERRDELASRGETFRTRTDTEVLLKALIRDGEGCLENMDAMFGLAFYDAGHRRLLLARDAFGEKPLYYTHQNGLFAFASELQALTLLPGFDAGIHPDTVALYLSLQYLPAPRTIYRSCGKLEPGSLMWVGMQGPEAVRRYFRFAPGMGPYSDLSLDEQADRLEEILLRSLRRRLLSDVPLGAFLSGGVDSATVVALATKRLNRSITTFSVGFSDTDETEHEEARAIARHLGTDHDDDVMAVGRMDLVERLGDMLDEPNADSSCLPTWLLCRHARRRVTVAISGDGGDEMFGGYRRYSDVAASLDAHPAEVAAGTWTAGRDYVSSRLLIYHDRELSALLGGMPKPVLEVLESWRAAITRDSRPLIDRLRQEDAEHYLPGAVLAKVDRMSMQHGLEVRTPYLSMEVARFAAALPTGQVLQGANGKIVLKHLAKRFLPEEWLMRPKRGFGLPVVAWGAQDHLLRLLRQRLAEPDSTLRQWIAPERITGYFAGQDSPSLYQLWALVILERWLRSHPARLAS